MKKILGITEATRAASIATSIDDRQFAARIQAGDGNAIQTVVETYLGQILRAARGAGLDPQRAEEVTQATFTTFIEKAEQFEGRSHVRTWLFDRHAALPL